MERDGLKIAVVALARAQRPCGVMRHASALTNALLACDENASIDLIAGDWQARLLAEQFDLRDERLRIRAVRIANTSISRNRWYWNGLPRLTRELRPDILHLAFPNLIHRSRLSCPVVTTLHDLYPYDIPQNFGYPQVFFNRLILRQCLENCDAIACVSQATMNRLPSCGFMKAARKAVVVPNCVELGRAAAAGPQGLSRGSRRFLLFVGQQRANKNIPLLLGAFHRLRESRGIDDGTLLVLAGDRGPETRAVMRCIRSLGLSEVVFQLEAVLDGPLRWLYEHAELLVAPSVVEGFGYPVAEALLSGTRVVCSDIPAFREIGGDRCVYFHCAGNAEENLADSICRALEQPFRSGQRLERFSKSAVGEQALALYRRLCQAQERSRQTAPQPNVLPVGP